MIILCNITLVVMIQSMKHCKLGLQNHKGHLHIFPNSCLRIMKIRFFVTLGVGNWLEKCFSMWVYPICKIVPLGVLVSHLTQTLPLMLHPLAMFATVVIWAFQNRHAKTMSPGLQQPQGWRLDLWHVRWIFHVMTLDNCSTSSECNLPSQASLKILLVSWALGALKYSFPESPDNFFCKAPQAVDGRALSHCKMIADKIDRDPISNNAYSRGHLLQCAITDQAHAFPLTHQKKVVILCNHPANILE